MQPCGDSRPTCRTYAAWRYSLPAAVRWPELCVRSLGTWTHSWRRCAGGSWRRYARSMSSWPGNWELHRWASGVANTYAWSKTTMHKDGGCVCWPHYQLADGAHT